MSSSSLSMTLHKAGTTFLPSSLGTRNQFKLPVTTTTTAAAADHYSSSSSDCNNKVEPLSSDAGGGGGIRRRLSSLSLHNLQDSISCAANNVNFHNMRSKSSVGLEHASTSIRKWWDFGWAWMLSRKPTFAQDLEMNDEEISFLGSNNRGSWRHLLYKLRSQLTKFLRSSSCSDSLPQTFRYNDHGIYNKKWSSSSASIPFPSGGGR